MKSADNWTKPTFICIGAPKAATTWLHRCLEDHPDVFVPDFKEVHFFNRYAPDRLHDSEAREWYESIYEGTEHYSARGECTPSYLANEAAARGIRELVPNCRLIVTLRNPVERAYSHYYERSGKYEVELAFDTLASDPERYANAEKGLLSIGLYASHLKTYISLFEEEQLLILFLDDLRASPSDVFEKVCDHIGVDRKVPKTVREKANTTSRKRSKLVHNLKNSVAKLLERNGLDGLRRGIKKTGIPELISGLNNEPVEKKPMNGDQRSRLVEFYRSDIEELEGLTGRDLSHWLEIG